MQEYIDNFNKLYEYILYIAPKLYNYLKELIFYIFNAFFSFTKFVINTVFNFYKELFIDIFNRLYIYSESIIYKIYNDMKELFFNIFNILYIYSESIIYKIYNDMKELFFNIFNELDKYIEFVVNTVFGRIIELYFFTADIIYDTKIYISFNLWDDFFFFFLSFITIIQNFFIEYFNCFKYIFNKLLVEIIIKGCIIYIFNKFMHVLGYLTVKFYLYYFCISATWYLIYEIIIFVFIDICYILVIINDLIAMFIFNVCTNNLSYALISLLCYIIYEFFIMIFYILHIYILNFFPENMFFNFYKSIIDFIKIITEPIVIIYVELNTFILNFLKTLDFLYKILINLLYHFFIKISIINGDVENFIYFVITFIDIFICNFSLQNINFVVFCFLNTVYDMFVDIIIYLFHLYISNYLSFEYIFYSLNELIISFFEIAIEFLVLFFIDLIIVPINIYTSILGWDYLTNFYFTHTFNSYIYNFFKVKDLLDEFFYLSFNSSIDYFIYKINKICNSIVCVFYCTTDTIIDYFF